MILASSHAGSATSHTVLLVVLLLAVTLLVALIAKRLRLPYTLILVLAGLLIGWLPIPKEVTFSPDLVLFLFLPPLLFEGAWNVDIGKIAADWLPILLLAVPGLLLSIAILAVTLHLGIGLPWLLAILLGAILSPTDPAVALALLKQLALPERLGTIVEGESLFNDGLGVAVYEVVLSILSPSLGVATVTGHLGQHSGLVIVLESLWLILGGPLLGLLVGWLVARFLLLVDDHLIETTMTFSVAYGAYLLGDILHTSGLLTVVGAGLVIGSYGRNRQMSQRTQQAAQEVWEFIAYLANSLLFLLLGMQIGASTFLSTVFSIFWAVLGIFIGRFLMIYLLISCHNILARHCTLRFLPTPRPLLVNWYPVFVLAGLRGALSLALILSLPVQFVQRKLLENIVYGVVLVTLLGQGLILRFILPHWPITTDDTPQVE